MKKDTSNVKPLLTKAQKNHLAVVTLLQKASSGLCVKTPIGRKYAIAANEEWINFLQNKK